ncbi:hypothetical protein ACVIW2_002270 [Bradyrhizobium huanghuaihaiense]|uniref:Uncharacterized protein n=2 Tax=Nitrobacteraceae TaxID=41294 RepID=A0A562RUU9_9BRAD|nr:hypothetical protein IQ16_02801 [Bradyrhizobium huanghuaihaiense]
MERRVGKELERARRSADPSHSRGTGHPTSRGLPTSVGVLARGARILVRLRHKDGSVGIKAIRLRPAAASVPCCHVWLSSCARSSVARMSAAISGTVVVASLMRATGDGHGHRTHLFQPSLRAQRSNPDCLRGKTLDCFATLAMTVYGRQRRSFNSSLDKMRDGTAASQPCHDGSLRSQERALRWDAAFRHSARTSFGSEKVAQSSLIAENRMHSITSCTGCGHALVPMLTAKGRAELSCLWCEGIDARAVDMAKWADSPSGKPERMARRSFE